MLQIKFHLASIFILVFGQVLLQNIIKDFDLILL